MILIMITNVVDATRVQQHMYPSHTHTSVFVTPIVLFLVWTVHKCLWVVNCRPTPTVCVNRDNKICDPNAFNGEFVFPFFVLLLFRFVLCYRCSYDASQEHWMKWTLSLKVACCCYASETDAECNESNKWIESKLKFRIHKRARGKQ